MESRLLLCDIGNTSLKIGISDGARLIAVYSFPTPAKATPDSLGLFLSQILRHANQDKDSFKLCVAVSVVPDLSRVLAQAIRRYLGCATLFVPSDLPAPLQNRYANPDQTGPDRLVGAYAARMALPLAASIIIVDMGTAITFDCVSGNAFLGGLIFPGPAVAIKALAANTAALPAINLDFAALHPRPGQDTRACLERGIGWGYICLTEGLCSLLRNQLEEPVKIVATGGFARDIGRFTAIFDLILPNLLLEGLALLYANTPLRSGQP